MHTTVYQKQKERKRKKKERKKQRSTKHNWKELLFEERHQHFNHGRLHQLLCLLKMYMPIVYRDKQFLTPLLFPLPRHLVSISSAGSFCFDSASLKIVHTLLFIHLEVFGINYWPLTSDKWGLGCLSLLNTHVHFQFPQLF